MSCRWICERCSGSFFRSSTWDSHLHVCSWFHGVLQLIAATYDPARFAFFFDLARFAFNVSPRRVRENSRNIFVRLVLARAVPERIQWILTVLLKKGTLTVGSSVGELMCQRPIIMIVVTDFQRDDELMWHLAVLVRSHIFVLLGL
jgi:hypothetical protein